LIYLCSVIIKQLENMTTYDYNHEDKFTEKHNNKADAMFFAAKSKGKTSSFDLSVNEDSSNTYTEEETKTIEELFGW